MVLLTGLPGSGKTILCRDIISKLDLNQTVAINIILSQLSAEELLRKIALELGLPAEHYNNVTLLSSIDDCMKNLHRERKKIIVFLDEAHNLLANDFTELRLLSSLQDVHYSVLQIVLIGNPILRESFFDVGMERVSLEQIATCEINCMTIEQMEGYIKHRLACVGWKSDPVIDGSVYSVIYDVTQGVAQSVNHVMSHLLLFGAFEKKHQINVDDAVMVIEMLIKDDRLTLHTTETLSSIKERYKATVFTTQTCKAQGSHFRVLSDESSPAHMGESLVQQGQVTGDVLSKGKLTTFNTSVGQVCEDTDYSFDDWDLPDTDWLDWDDQDTSPVHTSAIVSPAGSAHGLAREKSCADRSNGDHQWGGVWWMSDDVKKRNIRVCSLVTDELPSIMIEGCPDLLSRNAPVLINDQRRVVAVSGMKRKMLLALIVVSSVLLFLYLFLFLFR
jgi:type II secretory pathway predicted ATPase ExeA